MAGCMLMPQHLAMHYVSTWLCVFAEEDGWMLAGLCMHRRWRGVHLRGEREWPVGVQRAQHAERSRSARLAPVARGGYTTSSCRGRVGVLHAPYRYDTTRVMHLMVLQLRSERSLLSPAQRRLSNPTRDVAPEAL